MAYTTLKIKKGDTVVVLSGKDKTKQAKIVRTLPREGKVVLEGLFLAKKFIRPKKQGEKGQMVDVARAIPASKVMVVCKNCGKPARVGYRFEGNTKVRICMKCKNALT